MQLPYWVPVERSRLRLSNFRMYVYWVAVVFLPTAVFSADAKPQPVVVYIVFAAWCTAGIASLVWYLRLPVRRNSRRVLYPGSVSETMDELRRAFEETGRVIESSDTSHTIVGKCRYMLGSTKFRVSVLEDAAGSILELQPLREDIESAHASAAAERLLRALDELPDCK